MKKLVVLLFLFLAFAKGNAQLLNPVKWTTQIEKKSNGNYILTFNGVIESGWHLYSQYTAEGGSLPLEILFKNQKGNFELIGKTKESKTKTAYNDIFEVNETFFEKNAQLTQEIQLTNPKVSKIEVSFDYQVCKDACINLEKKFTFLIPSQAAVNTAEAPLDTTKITVDTTEVATQKIIEKPTQSNSISENSEEEMGLWSIFIIAFFSKKVSLTSKISL